MLTAAPMRTPLASAAARRVCAFATIASDKAKRHNANQFIRRSMGEPPFEVLPRRHRVRRQGDKETRGACLSSPFLPLPLSPCLLVSPLSEEPDEPRREAVDVDEYVARVGVGQTEPARQ